MSVTLRNTLANRHVAFASATGSADDVLVAVGSDQLIRVLAIFLSAATGGSGVICFGTAATNDIVLPFNLASNGNLSFYFPGGLISEVKGADLVINTGGSINGVIHYELVKKGS